MSDSDVLEAVVATELQRLERLSSLGNRGSAGPDAAPDATSTTVAHAAWSADGFWIGAVKRPAHPGRVGGVIRPVSAAVHTSDMLWEEWDALVTAWLGKPADGSCAHFLIGPDEQHGVVQFASVFRNANHIGGAGAGAFDTAAQKGIHPNLVTVGIELHCPGGVRLVSGQWRLVEDGVAHGLPIPAAQVTVDPARPGRGWANVTDYQRSMLSALLSDLRFALAPLPPGAAFRSTNEVPDAFTVMPGARVITHAQTNPAHRADPWHPVCDWLRLNYTALT